MPQPIDLNNENAAASSSPAPLLPEIQITFPEEKGEYSLYKLGAMSHTERTFLIECAKTQLSSRSSLFDTAELLWAAAWLLSQYVTATTDMDLAKVMLKRNINHSRHTKSYLSYYAFIKESNPLEAVSVLANITRLDTHYDMAQTELGHIHYANENFSEAFTCFKNAAEANPNYALAHAGIGLCYYTGNGITKHQACAEDAFLKYITARKLPSYNSRAISSFYHTKTDLYDSTIIHFFTTVHNIQLSKIQNILGDCQLLGIGIAAPEHGILNSYYENALELNPFNVHVDNNIYHAFKYHYSNDKDKAYKHAKRAFESFPNNCRTMYAMFLTAPNITADDLKLRFSYCWKSFQLNPYYKDALHGLYICFSKGLGTPINQKAAFECLKMLAFVNPRVETYVTLSNLYLKGYGTECNPTDAYQLLKKAYKIESVGFDRQRNTALLWNLALSYLYGYGTPVSAQKALNSFITLIYIRTLSSQLLGFCTPASDAKFLIPKIKSNQLGDLFSALERLIKDDEKTVLNDIKKLIEEEKQDIKTIKKEPKNENNSSPAPAPSTASNSNSSSSSGIMAHLNIRAPERDTLLTAQNETIAMQKEMITLLKKQNAELELRITSLQQCDKHKASESTSSLEITNRDKVNNVSEINSNKRMHR